MWLVILGPDQFGVYSYASAFVALFGTIARLGLDSIVVRDLVNHPEERDGYLGTAFWLKLIGGLLTLRLAGDRGAIHRQRRHDNLYIFIIGSGLIFQSFDVVDSYFQSKVLSKYVSIAKLIQLALSSVLKLYFRFYPGGPVLVRAGECDRPSNTGSFPRICLLATEDRWFFGVVLKLEQPKPCSKTPGRSSYRASRSCST